MILITVFNCCILTLIAFICAFVANAFPGKSRVLGGDTAMDRQSFQYQALLKKNGTVSCGGVIISESFVITAAHCVSNVTPDLLTVVIGSLKSDGSDENAIIANVAFIESHPNFTVSSGANDIAVIKLVELLTFNDLINKIEIAKNLPGNDTQCVISGWGVDKVNGQIQTNLKYVNVTYIGLRDCNLNYYSGRLKNGFLCAKHADSYGDGCKGDSGGPLVCAKELVGIISEGPECKGNQLPGVYVDVRFHKNFIDDAITKMKTETVNTEGESSRAKNNSNSSILWMLLLIILLFFRILP